MPTAQRVEDDETAIERERGLRAGQAEEVREAADGPGMGPGVRLGVDLGQARERVRRRAHVVAAPCEGLQRPHQREVQRRGPERRELAVEEEGAQQWLITPEVGVDGVEERVRRRLGEERQHVGEGLPCAPGRVRVGVVGDGRDDTTSV